jgi:hypothetical protein
VIPRHDLPGSTWFAVVEQNEVLDQVQEPLLGQHPVEQRFRIQSRLGFLGVALPLDEVLPLAGDGTVAGPVAVADHQESVVMECVGDAVLMQVVAQVIVEAGADVAVNGLQLDEDDRQAVDEADQVSAPVVVRHSHALDLQLTHGQKTVVRLAIRTAFVAKIDHMCPRRVSPEASRHSTGTPPRMNP